MSLRRLNIQENMMGRIQLPLKVEYRLKISRNRRFPYKSMGFILFCISMIAVIAALAVTTQFTTTLVIGNTHESVGTSTVINVDGPISGRKTANVVFEMIKEKMNATATTSTSSTTTTTQKVIKVMPWNNDPLNGVYYRKNDKEDLGACGNGNGGLGR